MKSDAAQDREYPVIVIGASQAGLTMAWQLKQAGLDYLVIGKEARIGDSWRNRYDSLVLFTPRWMSVLPGQSVDHHLDPKGYADKNEIAANLERYATEHRLRVQLDTEVTALRKESSAYRIVTNRGDFRAARVVVATGAFQRPSVPAFASQLSSAVVQLHTADYRNASQLQDGNVLIVGCGNSGAQIAVELAAREGLYLSAGGPISFVPQELLGKSIFWWFKKLGVYRAHIGTRIGRRLSRRGDPVIGKTLTSCISAGRVTRLPRAIGAQGERVEFEGGEDLQVANVIWATGYRMEYDWLQVAKALDAEGRPRHQRGIADAPGLYFLGLPWQYNRASALIGGVAADARYLLDYILSTDSSISSQPAASPATS